MSKKIKNNKTMMIIMIKNKFYHKKLKIMKIEINNKKKKINKINKSKINKIKMRFQK